MCINYEPYCVLACNFLWWSTTGDGKEVQIYDGRPDYVGSQFYKLAVSKKATKFAEPQNIGSVDLSGVGEIHYLRDSDDERPDSDEDPDDDLDIWYLNLFPLVCWYYPGGHWTPQIPIFERQKHVR